LHHTGVGHVDDEPDHDGDHNEEFAEEKLEREERDAFVDVEDRRIEHQLQDGGQDRELRPSLRRIRFKCHRLHRQRHRAARVRPCQHRSDSSTRCHRANPFLLWVAVVTTLIVLVTFVFRTLIHELAALVTLLVILALSMALDMAWKRSRDRRQVVS
jgi:hypothetical protein